MLIIESNKYFKLTNIYRIEEKNLTMKRVFISIFKPIQERKNVSITSINFGTVSINKI